MLFCAALLCAAMLCHAILNHALLCNVMLYPAVHTTPAHTAPASLSLPLAVELTAHTFVSLLELTETLIEDFYKPSLEEYKENKVGVNVRICACMCLWFMSVYT